MATGSVKWFSDAKGYGFIEPDGQEEADIFVHYTAIHVNGFRTLKPGMRVRFELHDGAKGLHAQAVTPLDANGQPLQYAAAAPDAVE